MQAKSRSPIVNDKSDVLQLQRLDEAIDVLVVIEEPVLDVGLVRLAHADEVHRDRPMAGANVGDDVSPQVRRRRVAVQEQHRVARPLVHVVDLRTLDVDEPRLEREASGNLLRH